MPASRIHCYERAIYDNLKQGLTFERDTMTAGVTIQS